jgi:hypothetical protein
VARRKRRGCRPGPDPDMLLAQLRAPDDEVRVKALHLVCPCGAGFLAYERFRGEVKRLQNDPSPRVRAAALHAEQDAMRRRDRARTTSPGSAGTSHRLDFGHRTIRADT